MTKGETVLRAEPGTQEVLITREFNAPRELVFKAFTDPKLYVQWLLGPKEQGLVMRLDRFVPKAGGEWRFIYTDSEGNEKFGFHGSYHEVLSPERIIDTFEIEGLPESQVSLETRVFEEPQPGRTRLTMQFVFQTVAGREGWLQSGAEEGLIDDFERLDELLKRAVTV